MQKTVNKTAGEIDANNEIKTNEEKSDKRDSKNEKRRISKQLTALISVTAAMLILNFIAWQSTAFCDFYAAHIFPLWGQTYGRLTSLLPFSFGEILIMIAVFGIPLSLIAMMILLILLKGKRKKIAKVFGFVYGWIIAFVLTTETLNCFILYHCSSFAELNGITVTEHTDAQLEALGDRIVDELNGLSEQVPRDADGRFMLTADLDGTAGNAMADLSEEFKNLDGYYVRPKSIMCSFFMSQMDLMGIYFPFSMEANYNDDMFKAKLPNTVCHELAHTKGYIQEDEANFIAFIACDRSDNVEYRYSGYLSALTQVRNKIFEYASDEKKSEFDSRISSKVWADISANWDYWDSVKEAEDTVFDSEKVSEVSDKAMETSLQLNGVEDGKKSYGRMVDLMLNYYYSEDK
ncbi:MAG: DUF3810 domain-containing protein [Ruminococcus sp.]|nr:DUF3810 domain-containing protein [Ruminococcus sp.]